MCRELDAAQEPRTLEDLAFALAARERDPDRGEPTNYQWEKVYAALYHRHIPVLADLDVVEFDAATGTVSRGCAFEQVWDALAAVDCAVGVEMPTDGCSARGGADE